MSAPGVEVVATIEEFGLDDEVVVSSLVVGRMVCWPPAKWLLQGRKQPNLCGKKMRKISDEQKIAEAWHSCSSFVSE